MDLNCELCANKKECFDNHWCVTMDRGRKINNEYICDNFELSGRRYEELKEKNKKLQEEKEAFEKSYAEAREDEANVVMNAHKVINNLAKAIKFMGTNEELAEEDIIKMFSPEEIKMDFDDFMKRWEDKQHKEAKLKEKVIDMIVEDISNSDIDEDICKKCKLEEDCYADTVEDDSACKECIKEYYFKKARGE